ncbi:DJ-1 family glyoxalase III [Leptospira ilyithenensis]|uniref:DJ-1/PfpI family protein n=1 Tax=Leptospira ilyithenensis TaxID=2484901 RepID=A0A4R9LIZ6_9LEPT|nr:DJ-1 family glyoxalase III [Leptospira ilyithenensis]TGN06837.1 DJ-1/PfpI family protein [Leptospira ilyithenensis]
MASTVLIPFAEGFEEMEGIILVDVLRRGSVSVVTASLNEAPVIAARKTIHLTDKTLLSVKDQNFDMIILPGGLEGAKNLQNSDLLKKIIFKHRDLGKEIGAICAAPNVLRNWGIISEEDKFTAFPTSLMLGEGGVYTSDRIVSHNKVFTSLGPGSAFEFALFILEKLEGKETRVRVEAALHLP